MVERNITEKEEEFIVNFGSLNYNEEQMSNILGWEKREITKLMKDKNSAFYKLYQKGINISKYLIDLKVFNMAKSGDMKAMHMYERIKKQNN